jgi:hypothetical protein
VERITGGLRLYPSQPPIRKRQVALPKPAASDQAHDDPPPAPPPIPLPAPPAPSPRIFISLEALEQVPDIAPGWDKYRLEQLYVAWASRLGQPIRNPDKAFLGWVKKFTKGRPPS